MSENTLYGKQSRSIGHFRVPPGLCFKTRLSAQPLIWKSFFILMQIKLIFTRKVEHLASFWKWGFLELGSGLLRFLGIWLPTPPKVKPQLIQSSYSGNNFQNRSGRLALVMIGQWHRKAIINQPLQMVFTQVITEIFAEIFCPPTLQFTKRRITWLLNWKVTNMYSKFSMFYIVHCIENKAFRVLTSFLAQM